MSATFRIDRLGAQGDGVAAGDTGPVHIPFTLPGETVTAARQGARAALMAVLAPSPLRVEPVCRHFGECGGCALQHMEAAAYREWKRGLVVQALAARGLAAEVAPLVACAPGSRRRLVLSARRTAGRMVLGFSRALSHTIIDLEACPVSLPGIVGALDTLREAARLVCATADSFRLTVTATDAGLDVAVSGSGRLSPQARNAAAGFALRAGLARLSVDGEIVLEPRKPTVHFGDVAAPLPPGSFLQAVAAAEEAMAGLVGEHLAGARKVADLFAGAGAFALRLAKSAEVHAVESDRAALAALDAGFRFGRGLKRVTTERRDLFVRPLTARVLNGFDAVVLDPPRAGAEAQSRELAGSEVPLVAAVSCNPATLARDLAILVSGGYRLAAVTPIDQFLWTPHVEAVALLEKPRKRQ